jgi:hypothetical protein
MKYLTSVALLLLTAFGLAQEGMMDPTPPKEMEQVSWLTGEWECKKLLMHFGGQTTETTGKTSGKMILNGRYLQSMNTYEMPGMGQLAGVFMVTYNPAMKMWVGHWFDSTAPEAMVLTGTLENNKLTLTSKAAEMMPEMRSTYTKDGDSVKFMLEMKQGEAWAPLMEGTFTKVAAEKARDK